MKKVLFCRKWYFKDITRALNKVIRQGPLNFFYLLPNLLQTIPFTTAGNTIIAIFLYPYMMINIQHLTITCKSYWLVFY